MVPGVPELSSEPPEAETVVATGSAVDACDSASKCEVSNAEETAAEPDDGVDSSESPAEDELQPGEEVTQPHTQRLSGRRRSEFTYRRCFI